MGLPRAPDIGVVVTMLGSLLLIARLEDVLDMALLIDPVLDELVGTLILCRVAPLPYSMEGRTIPLSVARPGSNARSRAMNLMT